ncbi:flagellar hook-associated protein FlgL [Catenovulum sediminis]|uniref:Flagellar hook-associated protein FlgL n=1 Tax=Catenovulum sediminis TaxID=1740262 RepID=A0ABV1RIN6_9ALTE|nr:flagellar hook-associated protein FlgL [Catenovulum sediminis]
MRLTTNLIYNRSLEGILESQKRLVRANDTLVKQTNILKPSDDPTGATKVVRFDEDLSRIEQFGKNTINLKNQLSTQETALTGINDALTRAYSLSIQAGNGALSFTDRRAVATELNLIKEEIADLMNSKNSQGEYLFAGARSDQPPFVENSAGEYVYQGDENVKRIQISETLKVEAGIPGSGFSIFEDTDARNNLSIAATSTASGTYRLQNGDSFDAFHSQNYVRVPPNPAGSNDYSIVLGTGTYQVQDNAGNVLDSGNFTNGEPVNFKGLEFSISGNAGDQLDFTLNPPAKSNILNAMDSMISLMQTDESGGDNLNDVIQNTLYSIQQAQENIGFARSEIGGRMNVIDSVDMSNKDLEINIKEAKAKVSEVDFAEAVTELQKQETAYQVANTTFGRITGLSLFNFI